MRLLFLTPQLPPEPGGVSDHSAQLLREAARAGVTTEAITFTAGAAPIPGVKLQQQTPAEFSFASCKKSALGADGIVVPYTPLSWAPRSYGIAPWLPLLLARIRRASGAPLTLIAHESHYPVKFSAVGLLVGLPQFLQFFLLAALADRVLFSHSASCRFWKKWLPWKKEKFSVQPVFSNIDRVTAPGNARSRFGLGTAPYLFYFGGAHEMNLLDFVVEAHRSLAARHPELWLVMAGVSAAEVRKRLPGLDESKIKILGFLPTEDISALYADAWFVLAPFGEGINTRRGSAMAALAHHKAVVTTRGWCTGSDQPWEKFLALAEGKNAYLAAVNLLADNPQRLRELAEAAGSHYERNFSVRVVTHQLLDSLRKS